MDYIQLNSQQITDYNNELLVDLWNVKSNSIWSNTSNNLSKINSNSSHSSNSSNSSITLNSLNSLNNLNVFNYNATGSNNSSHLNLKFITKPDDDKKPINTQLYKTELCDSFMKYSYCPYGNKCQFAHGHNELKLVERPSNYRSKPCINWVKHGVCRYGSRCCFKHDI